MIYSASCIYAQEKYHDGMFFLKKQIIFVLLGLISMFSVMSFDYHLLKDKAKILVMISWLLLILVLVPFIGREIAGARRWFRFGFLSFQPSEFSYIALIVYVASFISQKNTLIKESFLKGFLPVLFVSGITSILILLQPDLGTVFAINAVVLIMLFIAGVPKRSIIFIFLVSLALLFVLISTSTYRRNRLTAFLNPWQDPKGKGYQIVQSNIALGCGGILGRGLGNSYQKLFYLPAAHTDFIFSIIGEELGLLGTLSVCLLFINLMLEGLKISKYSPDTFGTYLSLGIIFVLSLKAVINIGVACGVLPTKGLPLPFISYGGSSLIFDLVGIGLVLNVSRFSEKE